MSQTGIYENQLDFGTADHSICEKNDDDEEEYEEEYEDEGEVVFNCYKCKIPIIRDSEEHDMCVCDEEGRTGFVLNVVGKKLKTIKIIKILKQKKKSYGIRYDFYLSNLSIHKCVITFKLLLTLNIKSNNQTLTIQIASFILK